jgi:hypothetical protein
VRWAEAARRLQPDNPLFLNTLGLARYRAGDYQEALAVLTHSDKLSAAGGGVSTPANLAFLAMTHSALGHKEQARALLLRLREVMTRPEWDRNKEAQAFLREAEAALDGNRAP